MVLNDSCPNPNPVWEHVMIVLNGSYPYPNPLLEHVAIVLMLPTLTLTLYGNM